MSMRQMLNGRYTITKPIGQGGMGVVYRGHDQQTGLPVAIKRLKADIAADPLFAEQFEHERQALQQLNHPRIAQLIESVKTVDNDYYLVMEYVPGGSLAELLEQEPPPIEQTLKIALDVASALKGVHQINIIHGDIKPGNILLAKDGTPRLMDFGAAHVPQATRLTQTTTTLGTFAYMSPEACQDEPLDMRTDIWSFGIMLYEMLAGKRPFNHPNLAHLTMAIMTEPTPDLQQLRPEVSDRLADLIYRMLTKDRNWRIPKMDFIIIELDALLYGSETIDTGFLAREVALGEEKSHNLPLLTTPLIGREQELAELDRLLQDPAFRLITLHGPGGIGKTSLALQAAHDYHRQTQVNTYFVDLSGIENFSQIITAIADAIQFNFYGSVDPQMELVSYLQNKEMLLVLDNFERATEGIKLLTDILFHSFDIQLLVTSQDRLNILEELRMPVQGLPVPETATYEGLLKAPAVQLFLRSVRHVQPAFVPTESEMRDIHQICQLVDGMPLGIQLAATSMNLMTPAEIARQVRVGDHALTMSIPDLPARHRSLRSVFEYSWILLNEEEKRDLRYLSVFRGGFERDAARQYGISLSTLNVLMDKSLLRRSPETGRYELPVIFRHFVADKLSERPSEQTAAFQSHADYYLHFLHIRHPHLLGERQQIALREIDIEIGNILAAWEWATHKQDRQGIGLGLEALYYFHHLRGRQQKGAELFFQTSQVLQRQPDVVFNKILTRLGAFYRVIGQLDDARSYLYQSLHLARRLEDKYEMAFALCQLGILQASAPEGRMYLEKSLAWAEEIEDKPLLAETLNWLAVARFQEGSLETAVQLLEKSLAISRQLKAAHGLALSLTNLGIIYGHRGQDDKAQQLLKEALQNYKQLNDLHGMATTCNHLASFAINAHHYRAALIWAEQALAYQREVGNKQGIGQAMGYLSEIAFYQADYEQARRICQEAIALYQGTNVTISPFFNTLGRIALAENDYATAKQAFQQALAETGQTTLILNILVGISSLLAQTDPAPALSLLTFIEQHTATEEVLKQRAKTLLIHLRQKLSRSQLQVILPEKATLSEWIKKAQQLLL